MENSVIEEFTRSIISKQESLLKERLFEYLGYELDILEESKRRFPRLLQVSKYNGADFYWNDGTENGYRLLSYYITEPDYTKLDNGIATSYFKFY